MNNETIINKLKDGNKQYVKGGIIVMFLKIEE